MRHDPQRGRPFRRRRQDLHQTFVTFGIAHRHEAQTQTGAHRRAIRLGFADAVGDAPGRHRVAQPAVEGRTVVRIDMPDKPVMREILRPRRHATRRDIGGRAIKRHRQPQQGLHHIIRVLWRCPGPYRHMRLAIIQPEQAHVGIEPDRHIGMHRLKIGKDRRQGPRDARDRGDDQFARHRLALAFDAADQLAELLFGALRRGQKVTARLGCGIAPGMALEQPGAQPFLQSIDVADHRGMVHAQHLCRPRNGAKPCHLIGRANLVPGIDHHSKNSDLCAPEH